MYKIAKEGVEIKGSRVSGGPEIICEAVALATGCCELVLFSPRLLDLAMTDRLSLSKSAPICRPTASASLTSASSIQPLSPPVASSMSRAASSANQTGPSAA